MKSLIDKLSRLNVEEVDLCRLRNSKLKKALTEVRRKGFIFKTKHGDEVYDPALHLDQETQAGHVDINSPKEEHSEHNEHSESPYNEEYKEHRDHTDYTELSHTDQAKEYAESRHHTDTHRTDHIDYRENVHTDRAGN